MKYFPSHKPNKVATDKQTHNGRLLPHMTAIGGLFDTRGAQETQSKQPIRSPSAG